MKKIKYRAWNCILKRFQPFSLEELENIKGKIQWHILTIEQFIGKEDKKGVEIYEGDYLVDRFPINDEDLSEGYNESLLPVIWCNDKLCWCVDVTFAKNGKILEPIYTYFGKNLEVKGNIHESCI